MTGQCKTQFRLLSSAKITGAVVDDCAELQCFRKELKRSVDLLVVNNLTNTFS
jgi:hypothetical protein